MILTDVRKLSLYEIGTELETVVHKPRAMELIEEIKRRGDRPEAKAKVFTGTHRRQFVRP
jgi:hypothetical protein